MRCGECKKPLERGKSCFVALQTARGTQLRIHFCNAECCYWGGVRYIKSGAPTTARGVRQIHPGAVE